MASELRVDKIIPSSGTSIGIGTVSGTINILGNSQINTTGVITATSFSGSGANLTSIPAAQLSGALPALDGSALTGVGASFGNSSVNSAGIATFSAFVPSSQGSLSHRNIIVNGDMRIAQRGTSSTSTGFRTVDRMAAGWGGTDEAPTISQSDVASGTTPYTLGFRKALKITNGNQTSGADTNDYIRHEYYIEAQDIANSGWNYTSSSSYLTLSYWVKSSVAQSFNSVVVSEDGTNRKYPFETGSLSADTWTKITKTIPGDSNLSFDNDTGKGLSIYFYQFLGSGNNSVSNDAWSTWQNPQTPVQTSTWYTTNDATYEITGIQLEVGPVATPFEHRSLQEELIRCQRYFNMIGDGTNFGTDKALSDAFMWSANEIDFMYTFPVEMRTTPSLYQVTGSDYFQVQGGGHNTHIDGNFTQQYGCKRSTSQYSGSDSSRTQGYSCHITVKNSAARYGYNAEF
mgnify:CR=1 FL=1